MRGLTLAALGFGLILTGCAGDESGADIYEDSDEDGTGDGDGDADGDTDGNLIDIGPGPDPDGEYCPGIDCDSDCGEGTCVLIGEQEMCDCNDGYMPMADGFGCVACDASGAQLDIEIGRHEISGRILFMGEPPPSNEYDDANIYLQNPRRGDRVWLGNTHDGGLLSAEVTPGIYEIVYESEDADTALPINNHAVLGAVDVVEDTNLELNVELTVVSGRITINGEPPPASEYDDGQIIFKQVFTGDEIVIANTNGGDYSVLLATGTYDVIYRAQTPGEVAPVNESALLDRFVLELGSDERDIDIPTVSLEGVMMVDDQEPPANDYDDANLYLENLETGDRAWLGNTNTGNYSAQVVAGSYHLVYEVENPGMMMPANRHAVLDEVEAFDSETKDINIDSIAVSGDLTINGAAPPASDYDDGDVYLRDLETGDAVFLGSTSAGSYASRVIPGQYTVAYSQETAGGTVPLNKSASVNDVELQADMSLDIDLEAIQLQGAITIGGEAPPDVEYADGRLVLRNAETGDEVLLGNTHDGGYSALVLPGNYSLHYVEETSGPGVPTNLDAKLTELAVVGDMSLDIDVPVVDLSGSFTIAGETPPSGPNQTGNISLHAGSDAARLGATNEGTYSARVVPGSYAVYYRLDSGTEGMPDNTAGRVGCVTVQ